MNVVNDESIYVLNDVQCSWIGDCNNVLNSLIAASIKFNFRLNIGCPKKYSLKKNILNLLMLARTARRKFGFCNPSARSAEKNSATLDQVTHFLWYLEMLGQHWVSADAKKHEGRAIHLQKTQWQSDEKLAKSIFRYFFTKTRCPRPFFFNLNSYSKSAL